MPRLTLSRRRRRQEENCDPSKKNEAGLRAAAVYFIHLLPWPIVNLPVVDAQPITPRR
jgi:hypothetical protein